MRWASADDMRLSDSSVAMEASVWLSTCVARVWAGAGMSQFVVRLPFQLAKTSRVEPLERSNTRC